MNDLFQKATDFIEQFYRETNREGIAKRLSEIQLEINQTGSYYQTYEELEFGAKLAWRNSNRCIGRLFWNSLKVRDCRHISTSAALFSELETHLNFATNGGKIRSTISIFPAKNTTQNINWKIWNYSLLQYAGYNQHATVVGDPKHIKFTEAAQQMGWKGQYTSFDLLPVIIQNNEEAPQYFEFKPATVLEIPIEHPTLDWFSDLNLKWYAVPLISNMILKIGGLEYTAAPFNGWYMINEIASRNFGDTNRYNLLPIVANKMGLDTSQRVSLWKDRAMIELNEAVLYSYTKAGVSIVDHHSAAEQFMQFNHLENKKKRDVTADWAWITPPMSASATPVYHQEWEDKILEPNFFYRKEEFSINSNSLRTQAHHCPFYQEIAQRSICLNKTN